MTVGIDPPALPLIEGRRFVDAFLDLREARWRGCSFDGCVLIFPPSVDAVSCVANDSLIVASPADIARRDMWAPDHLSKRPAPLRFTPPPVKD